MVNEVKNVSVGKPKITGAIFRAPVGTELPQDAIAPLNIAFKSMGYVSDDGVKNSNKASTDDVKAWGGQTVMTSQKEKKDEWIWTLIESLNTEVLKAVYGDKNVTGNLKTGIHVKATADEAGEFSWVVEMIMRGGVVKRIVLPSAKITEVGDVVYKDNDVIGYETTLTAFPDTDGATHHEYIKGTADD